MEKREKVPSDVGAVSGQSEKDGDGLLRREVEHAALWRSASKCLRTSALCQLKQEKMAEGVSAARTYMPCAKNFVTV